MSSDTSSGSTGTPEKSKNHFDELLNLDYTLYDKITRDFQEKLEEQDLEE